MDAGKIKIVDGVSNLLSNFFQTNQINSSTIDDRSFIPLFLYSLIGGGGGGGERCGCCCEQVCCVCFDLFSTSVSLKFK